MKMYFIEWPDKSFTIICGKLTPVELFWRLDEEGDPYSAIVSSTTDPCCITSQIIDGALFVARDSDCLWKRVIMPSFDSVQQSIEK